MTTQSATTTQSYHAIIRSFQSKIVDPAVEATQKTTTMRYIRLKLKPYLYQRPNNRARSLSTLMAVSVNKDTLHKIEFFRGLEISGKIFSRRYELSRGFEQGI